jgi:hypothetical protein
MNEIQNNEEIIDKIYKNYNLEEFCFCCQTLESRNISEMAKFQRNVNHLKIIRCQITYNRIDSLISFSKVRTLRLIASLFKTKLMESIAKLFNITTTLCNRLEL